MIVTVKTAREGKQSMKNISLFALFLVVGFVAFQLVLGTSTLFKADARCPIPIDESLPFDQGSMIPPSVLKRGESAHLFTQLQDRMKSVTKQRLVSVGGVVIFQVIGFPVVSKLFFALRRLRWVPILTRMRIGSRLAARIVHRASKISRVFRKSLKTVKNLYRKRSRLSIGSEVTNLIGNDATDNEAESP